MPIAADLDHVSLAVHDHQATLAALGRLGATWVEGGPSADYSWHQVAFAGGMRVEVMEPLGEGGFLHRFLASNGPGPHHLTFKVPDIEAALTAAEGAGYPPINIDLRDPGWKEAFLHPKNAHGVVVQLAWSSYGPESTPVPEWFSEAAVEHQPTLWSIAHAVADLDAACTLFRDLLGGNAVDAGSADGIDWVELIWPGPGRIRLAAGPPLHDFLGGRTGRLHHVGLRVDDPGSVPGAVFSPQGWEIPPSETVPVRVVLQQR